MRLNSKRVMTSLKRKSISFVASRPSSLRRNGACYVPWGLMSHEVSFVIHVPPPKLEINTIDFVAQH